MIRRRVGPGVRRCGDRYSETRSSSSIWARVRRMPAAAMRPSTCSGRLALATGATPLVFRTGVRIVSGVVVVVIASTAVALLLPFHEDTHELLARTAPTLLDLFVAAACALAGGYAVVISNSDVATTCQNR